VVSYIKSKDHPADQWDYMIESTMSDSCKNDFTKFINPDDVGDLDELDYEKDLDVYLYLSLENFSEGGADNRTIQILGTDVEDRVIL
jgi:hypothetical protein